MTAVLRDHARARAMSRSTIWRVRDEADLQPHRCVYWLNSHDPAFDAKARDICALYEHALRFYQQGRLVICVDEKTGMQILQRKHPTQLAQPGKPEKREQEYIRHGVRVNWLHVLQMTLTSCSMERKCMYALPVYLRSARAKHGTITHIPSHTPPRRAPHFSDCTALVCRS